MPQPSGQVLVDSGNSLAGALFTYANGSGMWNASAGSMLTKVGSGAVASEGGANVATAASDTYYTLPSAITLSGAFSLGFRCRMTAQDVRSMVLGSHTTTDSYLWLNFSNNIRLGASDVTANGGITSMTTWWFVRDGTFQPMRVYKNGVLHGTMASSTGLALVVSALMKGYSANTSYDMHGSLEFVHIMSPGTVLSQAQVESLTSDPYQILQAGSLSITAPLVDGGATAYSPTVSVAAGPQTVSSPLVDSGSTAYAPVVTQAGSGTIALTAPAAYRMHQRNVSTNTASVTIAGTYSGSPTSIQYRFAGGTWQTLVASPTGGAFSQSVTLSTGQGDIEVRFSNDASVTASRALVGVGDIYATAGQSNNVGAATSVVAPVTTNFTPVEYLGGAWVPLREGTTTGTSYSGLSGYGGSYFGALANRLQSNGVPVAFIPCAEGSTSIAQWQPGATMLFTNMTNRISAVGGIRSVIFWQGEANAINGTTQSQYETGLNDFIAAVNSSTGLKTFVIKIVRWVAGADTIRAAQDAVIASNPNVAGWADCDVYAASGVHYLTTTDINNVADRVYAGMVTAFYALRAQLSLTTNGVTPAANLSGIRWAWWDAAPPNLAAAPVDSGTGATTDASGVFSVNLTSTTLTTGQTGTLLAIISDGTAGSTANRAFCAPVQVT